MEKMLLARQLCLAKSWLPDRAIYLHSWYFRELALDTRRVKNIYRAFSMFGFY